MSSVDADREKVRRLLLARVFLESQVRGRHATGVSFILGGQVYTYKSPVPASDFFKEGAAKRIFYSDVTMLLGHTRYSTSGDYLDNLNNQPIQIENTAVAHNGVISQDEKSKWPVPCVTDNDSELLLRMDLGALIQSSASIAAGIITSEGACFFRNEKRPLVRVNVPDLAIEMVVSTHDIFKRAAQPFGLSFEIHPLEPLKVLRWVWKCA